MVFAHRDAQSCRQVDGFPVLYSPASLFELLVDVLAGLGFGGHVYVVRAEHRGFEDGCDGCTRMMKENEGDRVDNI